MTKPGFDPDAPAPAESGIFGLDASPEEAAVVLLPVPFEATTSFRQGAKDGPRAILAASAQLDLVDADTGTPYEAGIALLEEAPEVLEWSARASGLAAAVRAAEGHEGGAAAAASPAAARDEVNRLGERLNDWVDAEVSRWLKRDRLVGMVGGDHATAFGAVRAHLRRYPDMGVLHIDAHADLRLAFEGFTWSHASVMRNLLDRTALSLVQVAVRDYSPGEAQVIRDSGGRVVPFFDHELARAALDGEPWMRILGRVVDALPQHVYVSFDIDGLDPALCPNTGTPVPGGLSFHQAAALLAAVTRSGRRIVGFDLTEVAPGPGPLTESWDANVGARILYKLCGHGLLNRAQA